MQLLKMHLPEAPRRIFCALAQQDLLHQLKVAVLQWEQFQSCQAADVLFEVYKSRSRRNSNVTESGMLWEALARAGLFNGTGVLVHAKTTACTALVCHTSSLSVLDCS